VGLTEEVWLQKPSEVDKHPEVIDFVRQYWGIEGSILTAEEWAALMEGAGLEGRTGEDLFVRIYRVDPRREASQVKRYHLDDLWRMATRTLGLYLKSPAFRTYMRRQKRLPRDMFDHLGYAVLVGWKRRSKGFRKTPWI
jgi:hypothetical protein